MFIEEEIVEQIASHVTGGGSFSSFVQSIRESHSRRWMSIVTQYLQKRLYDKKENVNSITSQFSSTQRQPQPIPTYKDCFTSYVPSDPVFLELFIQWAMRRENLETKLMQGVDGVILSADCSHKISKIVYIGVNSPVFHGLYTIMNEYHQVVGFWFVRTSSLQELRPVMQQLAERYEKNGFKKPKCIFSDVPDKDRRYWESLFETLSAKTLQHPLVSRRKKSANNAPMLCLPDGKNSILITHISQVDNTMLQISLKINNNSRLYVGFDLEWTSFPRVGPVAVLQISLSSGETYIFHLTSILGGKYKEAGKKYTFLDNCKTLKTFLENGSILKVGSNSKNDRTKLMNDFALSKAL